MQGKFFTATTTESDAMPFGVIKWFSRPATTGAKSLVVLEVTFLPGEGHAFHYHPGQEEILYVLEGTVQQWLEQESKHLVAGDALYVGPDVVHASFNVSNAPVKLLAIVGPAVGDVGYTAVDVFDQVPWKNLR